MQDLLAVGITLVIGLLATSRLVMLLSEWPAASSRVWPWFRLQPWWPIASDRTAETLLRSMLSRSEYHQLRARAFLDIPSKIRPGRVYRIPRRPGQVQVIEHGSMIERLCLQPVDDLPEADLVLMHKLLLESDEQGYLHTANHFPRSIWR